MELVSHAGVDIRRVREEVFAFLTDCDAFPAYLRKHGPIAGIVRVEMADGGPPAKGARRLVYMTDGSLIDETIVAFEPCVEHGYRWTGTLKPPFSLLVRSGGGHWTFRDADGGTRVDWRYRFELRSVLLWPVAKPIMLLFGAWQRAGLSRARELLGGGPD